MSADERLPEVGPVGWEGFEVWDRTVHAPAGQEKKVAFVSVRVGGVVGMNRAAREMLGEARAVRVMYDPERERLGLVPTDPDDANSYYLGDRRASPNLSCGKLFEHYGVLISEVRRFHDLRVVDGIMVVDMRGGGERVERRGLRRVIGGG